jgi:hypothetical protein
MKSSTFGLWRPSPAGSRSPHPRVEVKNGDLAVSPTVLLLSESPIAKFSFSALESSIAVKKKALPIQSMLNDE